MATYQVTMLFEDENSRFSWTEKYYTAQNKIEDALTKGENLGQLRIGLCGIGPNLSTVTASDVSILGDSRQSVLNLAQDSSIKSTSKVSDRPYSSLLVRVDAGALYRKSLWLGGAPDDFIVNVSPFWQPSKQWTVAWGEFKKALLADFGVYAISKNPATNPHKPITNVVVAAQVATVTCPNHGFVNNQKIALHQVKGTGGKVNGYHLITTIDANSFKLQEAVNNNFVYQANGFAQSVIKEFIAFDKVGDPRPRKKSRGGRAGLVRGRR